MVVQPIQPSPAGFQFQSSGPKPVSIFGQDIEIDTLLALSGYVILREDESVLEYFKVGLRPELQWRERYVAY